MKKLLTLALLGILGAAGFSYSQEIPDGVKKYMYQLQHDPTVAYGFDTAKAWRFIDQDVQFKDWYVGLPFQFFDLNIVKLETDTMDSRFEDLMEPTDRWCIPVKINNDGYAYNVLVNVDKDGFIPSGCGEGVIGNKTWDEFRKKFPEESAIIPMFNYTFGLLYFPHKKDGKNIFHVRPPTWDDPMSKATSKSLDNPDDGKKVVALLKERMRSYREQQKESGQQKRKFMKLPASLRDTVGGKK